MHTDDLNQAYHDAERQVMARGISQEAMESGAVFRRGIGVYLYDLNGKRYIDFSAGILTNSLGQCHPYVTGQLKQQLDTLGNIHDFPSVNRLRLIDMLRGLLPVSLDTFVFLTTGSEAVEACLRMQQRSQSEIREAGARLYAVGAMTNRAVLRVHIASVRN